MYSFLLFLWTRTLHPLIKKITVGLMAFLEFYKGVMLSVMSLFPLLNSGLSCKKDPDLTETNWLSILHLWHHCFLCLVNAVRWCFKPTEHSLFVYKTSVAMKLMFRGPLGYTSIYANVCFLQSQGLYFSWYPLYAHLPTIMNTWSWSKIMGCVNVI